MKNTYEMGIRRRKFLNEDFRTTCSLSYEKYSKFLPTDQTKMQAWYSKFYGCSNINSFRFTKVVNLKNGSFFKKALRLTVK